ncbi:MAG: hypothetical protein HY233_07180 [Acidobacteriales bacterium]|nr:hypothetical protein [Terriglobales bacterium]
MKHGILVCTLAAGLAWAQSPEIIQNTRTMMNTVQKNATAASNEALGINQPAAKDSHAPAKPAATAVKSSPAVVKTSSAPAKASVAPAKVKVAAASAPAKASVVPVKASASAAPKVAVKQDAAKKEGKPEAAQKKAETAPKSSPAAAASSNSDAASAGESEAAKADDSDSEKDKQDKKWSMSGKRDPFISPVVNHAGGSGCSTGKKCLEIGAINLKGVVHSDAGFIAVVTNSLNKAYFLRENDPVFDGYVVKITGDSIVFKETLQDRLGKTFTREVVKKITTPAV